MAQGTKTLSKYFWLNELNFNLSRAAPKRGPFWGSGVKSDLISVYLPGSPYLVLSSKDELDKAKGLLL